MQYPLEEKIGVPELLVERKREAANFGEWLSWIPKKLAKSRVILARRKSGKTAFVQRIFNRLWNENGTVIPFYFDVADVKTSLFELSLKYYRAFASQYISFLERDASLVGRPLTFGQIKAYAKSESLSYMATDVDLLLGNAEIHPQGLMWDTACSAPHRYASNTERRFLVILDEFQNLSAYIYRNKECTGDPDDSIPGSYHNLSESKIAPMLVTGSYVSWLIRISAKYLQASRLEEWYMDPFLAPEEGLEAVYRYAEVYDEPITNDTALQINRLCMSDPFFISCVMKSKYSARDLSDETGVIDTVNYEITDRNSQMQRTWGEYIEMTLSRINDLHSKNILLHLSKNNDREWTPRELKEYLQLPLSAEEIRKRLHLLVEADVIEQGNSDIRYHGLQDGMLNLILRNRFEEEISTHAPPLKKDFRAEVKRLRKDKRSLQGMLNNVTGQLAEYQLAYDFRARRRFALSVYFDGVKDKTELDITDIRIRPIFKRDIETMMEFDVLAESSCGRTVLAEVKKRAEKSGVKIIRDFLEKVQHYKALFPKQKALPVVLSVGGFTHQALALCREHSVGVAVTINYFQPD